MNPILAEITVISVIFAERCPAGKYLDPEAGLCRSCGHGFYQPNEGSFSCMLCGLGKTTRTTEAVAQEVTNHPTCNIQTNALILALKLNNKLPDFQQRYEFSQITPGS